MKLGYFTERPYQSPEVNGRALGDLDISNDIYDPVLAGKLLNRYIDEKIYAEEVGFDMLMLNEHHSTPFQIGGVQNVEASILARVTNARNHRLKYAPKATTKTKAMIPPRIRPITTIGFIA